MSIKANQPSFAAGEIAPELYGRVDLAKYATALRLARNFIVRPHGGLANRAGTRFVAEVIDSSVAGRLVPFSYSTEQTYILEFGDELMRVILDGGLALETAVSVSSITQANPGVVTATSHGYSDGDEIVISGGTGMQQIKGDVLIVRNATTHTFEVGVKGGSSSLDTTGYVVYQGGASVGRVYSLATPYAAEDLPLLKWVQSADVMYLVHPDYDVRKLSRTGHTSWTIATVDFEPGIEAPANLAVTATYAVSGSDTLYMYKSTAIDDDSGEESLPNAAKTGTNDLDLEGNSNEVSWDAVTGAGRYEVYKEDNGVFGYIGGTEATSFIDRNITPDLSSTPPKVEDPFAGTDNKPSCACFFEQRLVFGSTRNKPQTIWMSTTANFENFGTRSIAQDDDAVEFTLVARQVNKIHHLVAKEDLWALTSGGEWRIRGGGDVDFITPSSVTTKKVSSWGSADITPIEIGTSLLYVVAKGQGVRDLFNIVALTDYETEEGSDLSILAPHLFEDRAIKAWAYAQVPYSLIWVVMDDGALLSFTYYREHRVYAWTQHVTESGGAGDGVFEEVAAIDEGTEDVPYFIVRRTVGGQTKRYIERLPKRVRSTTAGVYLDCSASYSGAGTTEIYGLRYLAGRTVSALADGHVITDLVVDGDGTVTIPITANVVHIGLPYQATGRTLPLEMQFRDGATNAREKRLVRLTARVRDSRGLWIGPAEDNLYEWRQRTSEVWGAPIDLYSGKVEIDAAPEWDKEADLWFVQQDPLPLEILSITPEFSLGR